MTWVGHSLASRLQLKLSLFDIVGLPLLPPAVLAGLMAESTAEGGDVTAIQAAVDLQNDPSRRMELCHTRQQRSRPFDRTVVAVSFYLGWMYRIDSASLAVTAVAGVDPLPGLSNYAVAGYGGMVFIAGGEDDNEYFDAVRCFDPRLPYWSDLPPLPSARVYACAAVLDGCLFVCGGYGGGQLARVDKLCLRDQVWTTAAPLPSGLSGAMAVVQNGQLYVIGGYTGGGYTDEILRYDGIGDTWAVVAALSGVRARCCVAADDDRGIFVVGGCGFGGVSTVVERLDTHTLQVALPFLKKSRRRCAEAHPPPTQNTRSASVCTRLRSIFLCLH